jgi:hypothetical protein
VLEPLLTGLEQKGFCFATLREHPDMGKRLQSGVTVKGSRP